MISGSRGVGHEAYATGVVLSVGIEGGSCNGGGVTGIVRTGTGRMDPLPSGHGVS
jgi:hypothetical protein